MRKNVHRGSRLASLLGGASLALAICFTTPVAARPIGGGAHAASTAGAQERATLREEREAAREQRLASRAQRREERLHAREERLDERERRRGGQPQATQPTAPVEEGSGRGAGACRVTIEASAARITAGESVTIFGKASCPSGIDAARQTITITQSGRTRGVHSFASLATATVETDGSYELAPQAPSANTIFRATLGRHSARTVVRVAPTVTLSALPTAQASARPGSRGARRSAATFAGTVSPAAAGTLLSLQETYPEDGEQWRTIAFGRVGEGGAYSISHGFSEPGEVKIRVIAHTKGVNVPGASEAISYTVAQPQNPQLTIASSADPILSGQSATLSGVAAGTPGQTVNLLARSKGGEFATVASTTTDPTGAYSFTQSPAQSTTYEVSDAGAKSIAIFEAVEYRVVTETPPSTLTAGSPLSLSGTVSPAPGATVVYLERENPSALGFHAIATGAVAPDGSFTITHTFASAGSAVLRVAVPGDALHRLGATAPFTVALQAAPAAALTPEAPAPPTTEP